MAVDRPIGFTPDAPPFPEETEQMAQNVVDIQVEEANPNVEIRDKHEVTSMLVREVSDETERQSLWDASVEAYPPYAEYQAKTDRVIPVFIAEPV